MRFMGAVRGATLIAFILAPGLPFTAAVHVAGADDISDLKLRATHIRTDFASDGVTCTGQNCSASRPVFDPPEFVVHCKGHTCTFRLSFCGSFLPDATAAGDDLFMRVLVDGESPHPGPIGPGALVTIVSPIPQGGSVETRCFTTVSADNARGDHTIQLDFGAINRVGNDTRVFLRESTLTIEVYHP